MAIARPETVMAVIVILGLIGFLLNKYEHKISGAAGLAILVLAGPGVVSLLLWNMGGLALLFR